MFLNVRWNRENKTKTTGEEGKRDQKTYDQKGKDGSIPRKIMVRKNHSQSTKKNRGGGGGGGGDHSRGKLGDKGKSNDLFGWITGGK